MRPALRFASPAGASIPRSPQVLPDALRGAHVELVLQPNRFMFRPLELPRRASDFLEGIVRAQIDRLTPWSAADAAFGWHPSIDTANDRIDVTIAATARTLIAPFISAITALGADTVIVSAALPQPEPEMPRPSRSCEQKARTGGRFAPRPAHLDWARLPAVARWPRCRSQPMPLSAATIETRRDDLMRQIEERRAALQAGTRRDKRGGARVGTAQA